MFKNKKFSEMIKIYAMLDIVLFIILFLMKDLSGIFRILPAIISFTGYFYILDLKFRYPQWYVNVKPFLYFLVLFLMPELCIYALKTLGVSDSIIYNYRIEAFLLLIAKLGLYIRSYILSKKLNLDKYTDEETVAKDFPRVMDK